MRFDFNSWFRESKVLACDGNPLLVYHGTNSIFKVFKDVESRQGFYFTADQDHASLYTSLRPGEPRLVSAFLCIRKPADLRAEISDDLCRTLNKSGYDRTGDLIFSHPEARWEFFHRNTILRDIFEQAGFDGVRLTEPQPNVKLKPIESWMAFYSNQIKIVSFNNQVSSTKNPTAAERFDEAMKYLEALDEKTIAPRA